MTRRRAGTVLLCVLAAFTLFGAVSSASASDASIKKVIKTYNPELIVSEGHTVTAIGEYKKTGNPKKVQAELTRAIAVLRKLKSAIANQSAVAPRVKAGRAKLVKGLQSVIVAYQRLRTAFGVRSVSKSAARAEAKKALAALRRGHRELEEGLLLLK